MNLLGKVNPMFEEVIKKLERAGWFLLNLKALAEDAGGLAFVKPDQQQAMRANLDGFFFEIISAKDFFLQKINDKYGLGLSKMEATKTGSLIRELRCRGHSSALNVVTSIKELLNERNLCPDQKLQDDDNSWLWRLNNYRNSATHRELLHVGHVAEAPPITVDKDSFDKIRQGNIVMKPIFKGQDLEIPSGVPRVDIPCENVKTFLFKDPEDSSKGNADTEALPYCEQSLERMRNFLEELYSKLTP
jgi:hypothetical protein